LESRLLIFSFAFPSEKKLRFAAPVRDPLTSAAPVVNDRRFFDCILNPEPAARERFFSDSTFANQAEESCAVCSGS